MKYVVMDGFKVLEIHDDYAEAFGALVFLHASSIDSVPDEIARNLKKGEDYKPWEHNK